MNGCAIETVKDKPFHRGASLDYKTLSVCKCGFVCSAKKLKFRTRLSRAEICVYASSLEISRGSDPYGDGPDPDTPISDPR